MLILFAKYTLLMCFAIISDISNCEKKLYEASTGGEIHWKAACTAKCLSIEKNKNFVNCFDECQPTESSDFNIALKKINENHDLILLCRDDRSITLKVVAPTQRYRLQQHHHHSAGYPKLYQSINKDTITTNWTVNNNTQEIYIVNISQAAEGKDISAYLSDENVITIGNLSQNTTYNVSVSVVYSSEEFSIIAKTRQFTTLRRGYKPRDIQEISLMGFEADESDAMLLTALISWKPSFDMTCRYDLICYSPETQQSSMEVTQIRDPQDLYTYQLDNLTFATVYNIGIRAMNTNDASKESALKWEKITTPSCTEWHNMNFNICAPFTPEELNVKEHFLVPNVFSLNITWKLPKYKPDFYTLRLLDLDQLHTFNVKKYDYNVSKDESWYFISNLTLNGMLFETHLTAHTQGGTSTAVITKSTNKPHLLSVSPDRNYVVKLALAIFAPLLCIVILSLTVFIVCHRRAKLKRFQERCKYFEELEKKAPIDPKSTFEFTKMLTLTNSQNDIHQFQLDLEEKLFFNDDMEVNRNDVKLYEVLGEGAFGLVRRGLYHHDKQDVKCDRDGCGHFREVAVKMLKDQPSVDDIRAFRREIEVMKSVGRHPNIVGIIGHCTRKCNEMLLLTEYCSLGNLLIFLRNEWKYLHELSFRNKKPFKASAIEKQHPPHQFRSSLKSQNIIHHQHHHHRTTENEFNFDSTAVQNLKTKYKNINLTSSSASTAYAGSPIIAKPASMDDHTTDSPLIAEASSPLPTPPPLPPSATTSNVPNANKHTNLNQPTERNAKFNKSYGYEDICTNACKCRVDILISPSPSSTKPFSLFDTDPARDNVTNEASQQRGQIKISRKCECKLKRTKMFSIDNEGYYKNLTSHNSSTAAVVVVTEKDHTQQQRVEGADALGKDDVEEAESHIAVKREPLRTADLLEIAKQVALGMEFLSKNKVVHRDLAARNVLVSSDRTLKIADFGLSRDVYQENVYKKTGNGKLPIKWLALESMTHQVYTSQSDVWSFGILLYEIITLGGIPYPSIPTNRLIHLLKTGYRMEKPKNCSQGLYNLMMACWNFNPAERPNFTEIIKMLDSLSLVAASPKLPNDKQLNATTPKQEESPETPSSDDSYLRPL